MHFTPTQYQPGATSTSSCGGASNRKWYGVCVLLFFPPVYPQKYWKSSGFMKNCKSLIKCGLQSVSASGYVVGVCASVHVVGEITQGAQKFTQMVYASQFGAKVLARPMVIITPRSRDTLSVFRYPGFLFLKWEECLAGDRRDAIESFFFIVNE